MRSVLTIMLLAVAMLPALGHAQTVNICDRTPQVRDQILQALGANDCAAVDSQSLSGLTRLPLPGLTGLKAGDFDGLPGLQQLVLAGNQLASLPAGAFDGLTSLQILGLIDNQLTALPAGVFDKLTSLQRLDVRNTRLAALPAGAFDKLTSLQWLDLSTSRLAALPAGAFDKLTRLQRLDLSTSRLAALPAGAFDKLTRLQRLDLSTSRLAALPAGVFDKLTRLQYLDFGGNQLTALPAGAFDRLTSLQFLYLQGNQLASLPAGAFDRLTSLAILRLHSNQLTSLPSGVFDRLTSLLELVLHSNQLTALPDGLFDRLTSLKRLDLRSNQLTALPDGLFDRLTSLRLLDLRTNHLSGGLTDSNRLFSRLPSGVSVYLDGQTEAPGTPTTPPPTTPETPSDNGGSDGGATSPTHTHPYAPVGHTHDAAEFHTHNKDNDVRYAAKLHEHDANYATRNHTHPKRSAARLRLACGERCEAMARQPNIADLIEDAFWLEQAQCSTPRTRSVGAASCRNSAVGRRGLTYCGGGEGNLNGLMTNPPSGVGGKEITISEGVKASVAQTLALQIAELGLTCEEAAVVLYRGQFHLDTCQARADYGRMAQAITEATGWDGLGVTLPTLATITRNRKCGDSLTAAQ